ncbi:MAG: PAS domain S-box protein [Bacilli bacterium]|nr:PAS domain S-box protein [Bacilli bacterium]
MLYKALNNIAVSYIVLENDKIIDCNLNAVNLFGYDRREDLLGLSPFDLSPYLQDDEEESHIKGKVLIEKAYREKMVSFKWRHTKKNGDTFLAFINLISINGLLFSIITNIDELQEAEAKIRQTDDMYRLLFDESQVMIYFLDVKTKRITNANKATLDFYGYDLETIRNIDYIDICQLTEDELNHNIELVLMNKRNYFYSKHICANGETRDVEIHAYAFTLNNRDFIIAMVYDLSERIKQNLIIESFLKNSPTPIAVLDNDYRVIDVNDKFTELFLYTKNEVIGRRLDTILTPNSLEDVATEIAQEALKNNFVRKRTIRRRKDETIVNVEIVAFPIIYNEKIIGTYIHYIDITQTLKHEMQLEVFQKVLENNTEGIVITDPEGRIEWVNHAFTCITGYQLSEVKGKTMNLLRSNVHNEEFYDNMWETLNRYHHWHGEIWNKNKNGEIYPEWLNIYAIKSQNNITNYVGIFRDLSETKVIDQKIRILSQKDVLTGLYNRVYFNDNLERVIKKEENVAILFMDLNHFKEINDTLGHYAGDQFLMEIAHRLEDLLNGNNDTIIARYGGDEFIVMIENFTSKKQIASIARRILHMIQKPFIYGGNYLIATASLGISLYPKDGRTSDELLQNADMAMYAAKNKYDRKIMFYNPNMRKAVDERFKIASLLRAALEEKAYEILFDPIYSLKKDAIIALEAKIKWHNKQLALYSRQKYIDVAIKTGQINHIFDFVFEDICQKLTENQDLQMQIPISINISIEQLEQYTFLSQIKDKLCKYNIDPSLIEFEFTDNNISEKSRRAQKAINELLKLGFNFTLDNFGQDNSSIAQLKHYNIKKIKLTKSIFKDIDKRSINYELIKLYRLITKKMNILLIAKGINEESQYKFIKDIKVDAAQGSYFSKPLTFEEVKKALKH